MGRRGGCGAGIDWSLSTLTSAELDANPRDNAFARAFNGDQIATSLTNLENAGITSLSNGSFGDAFHAVGSFLQLQTEFGNQYPNMNNFVFGSNAGTTPTQITDGTGQSLTVNVAEDGGGVVNVLSNTRQPDGQMQYQLAGQNASVNTTNQTVAVQPDGTATVNGSGNNVTAEGPHPGEPVEHRSAAVTLTGDNNTLNLDSGASANITGTGETISGANATIATGTGSSINVIGSGDTVQLGASSYMGLLAGSQNDNVYANGDNIATQNGVSFNLIGSNDTATLGGNSYIGLLAGSQSDNVYANGDSIATQNGVNFNLIGSNDSATLGANSYIGLIAGSQSDNVYANCDSIVTQNGVNFNPVGSNDSATLGANSYVGLIAGSQSDNVYANGDSIVTQNGVNFNLVGSNDSATLGANSYVGLIAGSQSDNVYANGDSIVTQNGVSFNLVGSNDSATLGANSYIGLIAGSQSDNVYANGDSIVTQNGVSFNLIGSNDSATLGANSYIGLIAGSQSDNVYASGDSIVTQNGVSFNLIGSNDSATLGGNSYIGLIAGDQNESVYASNDHIVAQNNVGMTIFGAGDVIDSSNNTIDVQGSGSSITLNGTGNTIHLDMSGETLTETSPGETANHITIPDAIGSVEYIDFADGVQEHATIEQGGVINLSGYDPTNPQDAYHFSADFGPSGYETSERDSYDSGGIVDTTWDADGSGSQTGSDSASGAEWSSFSDSFNSYDQLTSERIYYPDGTSSLTQFATGPSNDPEYTTYYNPTGASQNFNGWGYDPYDAAYTANIGDYYFSDAGDEGFGDPVVLSLGGGPVQTTPLAGSNVYFDRSDIGQPIQTAWISQGEALLVYDPGRTGSPTQESDLVSGFDQMRTLDSNSDGVLDASDPVWSSLGAWIANGSAKAEPVVSLDQLGITSINLNAVADGTNNFGNTILADSTFTHADGTLGQIAAVDLAFNPAHREPAGTGFITLPPR
ncbi:MAG: hypothetical protein QOF41_2646 [Methylobacteriaceae bacterium]|nr:hypothetical protein [Methylobacteriaceae bacterium]